MKNDATSFLIGGLRQAVDWVSPVLRTVAPKLIARNPIARTERLAGRNPSRTPREHKRAGTRVHSRNCQRREQGTTNGIGSLSNRKHALRSATRTRRRPLLKLEYYNPTARGACR